MAASSGIYDANLIPVTVSDERGVFDVHRAACSGVQPRESVGCVDEIDAEGLTVGSSVGDLVRERSLVQCADDNTPSDSGRCVPIEWFVRQLTAFRSAVDEEIAVLAHER